MQNGTFTRRPATHFSANIIIWNGDMRCPPTEVMLSNDSLNEQSVCSLLNENTKAQAVLGEFFICKYLVDDLVDGVFIGHYFISNCNVEAQSRCQEEVRVLYPSQIIMEFDSEQDGNITARSLLLFMSVLW
jgi:hypothetical protein